MPLSVLTGFRQSGSAYPEWHDQNYAAIKAFVDALETQLNSVSASVNETSGLPAALQEILDRRGLIGKESYDFDEGTLSGPSYNLTVSSGGYILSNGVRRKTTSTTISMAGKGTGTYYINVDSSGIPTVSATASSESVRSFSYNSSTHVVSDKEVYSGVSILFDGDEWQRLLTSTARGMSFDTLSERIEDLEGGTGQDLWASYYAQNTPHSGLTFKYKAGKVRDDATIRDTAAGQISLSASSTNYIELNPSDGTVSYNTTGFTSGKIPLYQVVTTASAISTVTDKRTSAISGTGGGGGGGHTQGTDLGTTNTTFTIDTDAVGSPTGDAGLIVENGSDPNAGWVYDRDEGKWKYTVDGGATYIFVDETTLLGTEFNRYVSLDQATLVADESDRSSSVDFEEIDLSSYLTEGNGAALVTIVVFFTDTSPGTGVYMAFRKAGVAPAPTKAAYVWSNTNDPGVIHVEPDDDGKIEFWVAASGTGTASYEVYLVNYVAKVSGSGTVEKTKNTTGIGVSAGSSTTQNITAWMNRGLVHYLKIEETGGSMTGTYDIEFFGKDTFLAADLMYKAEDIDPSADFEDWLPWWYKDKDGTSELHVKITNNDGSHAGTFSITLEAEQFG